MLNNNLLGGSMNWFRVIVGTLIIAIVGIIVLIDWYKNIDSDTSWIYGIYVGIHIILSLFVLIALEQYWLMHD